MTREERLKFCKVCTNRKFDVKTGLICSLTGKIADFDETCPNFSQDERENEKQTTDELLKQKAEVGKIKAIKLFIVMVGISFLFMIFPYLMHKSLTSKEIIRLVLTLGLYYAVYIGKNWAKKLLIVLLFIAILILLPSIIVLISTTLLGLLLLIPLFAYSYLIYFLIADKDFAAFFEYQKKNSI